MANKNSFINGNRYSWVSIGLGIDGADTEDFIAISYKASQEIGKVRGKGHRKRGRTKGNSDSTGSFTLLKAEANRLIKRLGPGYMTGKRDFPITVSYSETGESQIITDELIDCRIIDTDDTRDPGTDAAAVVFQLDIGQILYDGIDPQE